MIEPDNFRKFVFAPVFAESAKNFVIFQKSSCSTLIGTVQNGSSTHPWFLVTNVVSKKVFANESCLKNSASNENARFFEL